MAGIAPQPGIMEIDLYQGGASKVDGVEDVVKLSSNENPFGPSPDAQAAFRASASALHRYPPTDHSGLRLSIAEVHGLDAERIICGVGSDEIIAFLCQAYVGAGDEVIHTEHGFAMYRISTLAAGGTPVEVREAERKTDVDAILNAVTERTRLVFIANPNNPTGTLISDSEVARLAEGLPDHVLLVLDGAYVEFVDGHDGGAALVDSRENVVMTRTFSKLYGLGGLRIGWGYGPRTVIDVLNRIRGPFNLSETQLATAEAAIRDRQYAVWCRNENSRLRNWLAAELEGMGIPSDESHANFILARFADAEKAQAADATLKSHGLIVRNVAGYGLPQALRITIGDEAACRRVAAVLRDFMGEQG
ncbi:histidinol phosphate aminotransferase apoenzyme [Poseidonocella pacifica]|uniref:Histidinol-phosphate aminotransferase n=1 Tax=Poseidonocella pacifica TaxID=871651 RepID=A0A1I0XHE9_9RHOB|nr:histidinol-phosphate transaminase [Poseidonocella pacifica]SFA99678.1 histidinol phosphate aminotransferase apoenzyme [Poseidonocella pacifica]